MKIVETAADVLTGVTLLKMDNGDEALYVGGALCGVSSGRKREPSRVHEANAWAAQRAQPVQVYELPSEGSGDTDWTRVIAKIRAARGTVSGRASLRAVVRPECDRRAVHFCGHPQLSGRDDNLWFSVAPGEELFAAMERILRANGVAENLTRMIPVAEHHNGREWEITYNLRLSDNEVRS